MTNMIKKIQGAITLLLITSVGYAYGDYDSLPECGESGDCCPCQPICCGNGFISADFLYWRPFVSGIDECVSDEVYDTSSSDGKVFARFSGKDRDPNFRWDPGFRIGAGYQFACSNWDVAGFYTHFHSNAHGLKNRRNNVRWKIDFDLIDVIAGYEADIGFCFTFRPFIGLRGARIDQKLHVGEFRSSTSYSTSYSRIYYLFGKKNKEKFLGIGPLIGLEADWNIGCGFSLYASASTSWLYGKFRVRLNKFDDFSDIANSCRIRKHLDAILANFDAALGIRWETCLCSNRVLILEFGLEHHQYFNYNRIGNYGDLSFDGVNFSAGIQF